MHLVSTDTWVKHVLTRALDDLKRLIDNCKQTYPIILDVGCGHGYSLWMLEQRFKPNKIIGLDIDPEFKTRAQPNVSLCNCEVQLQNNNAIDIDLDNDSVDMLFCHQTFTT